MWVWGYWFHRNFLSSISDRLDTAPDFAYIHTMSQDIAPASSPSSRPLCTILQAAALAQVSRRTIYLWLKAGKVEWVRTAGGSVRIYRDSVLRKEEGRVADGV